MDLIQVRSSQSISNKMVEQRIPKLLMHYCACRSDPANSGFSKFICHHCLVWSNSTCYFFKMFYTSNFQMHSSSFIPILCVFIQIIVSGLNLFLLSVSCYDIIQTQYPFQFLPSHPVWSTLIDSKCVNLFQVLPTPIAARMHICLYFAHILSSHSPEWNTAILSQKPILHLSTIYCQLM